MMTGDSTWKAPDSGAGAECMRMLRGLGREELLEILSEGFCEHCHGVLQSRVLALSSRKLSSVSVSNDNVSVSNGNVSVSNGNGAEMSVEFLSADSSRLDSSKESLESFTKNPSRGLMQNPDSVYFERRKGISVNSSPASVSSIQSSSNRGSDISLNAGLAEVSSIGGKGLSEEQERIVFAQVGRKKNFVHIEKINGKATNVVQGLELHTRVFSAEEQKKIVECVYNLQKMGQKGRLRERTYTEPTKWMRGKGRITIQFGCCYNYAVDKYGNPPGIIRDEEVDPLPPVFKQMIKRMVRWHVLPPTRVPNSCIVNIYDEGDCIPPHIDHHDFLRPFCTVSFLTECNILFGSNLKIVGPGEFSGPVSIPMPLGSVLILNGNGADVAKHCVPGVPAKRISITFRKMDDSKLPYKFALDPELQGIRPLVYMNKSPVQQNQQENRKVTPQLTPETSNTSSFLVDKDEFPPLAGSKSSINRQRGSRSDRK